MSTTAQVFYRTFRTMSLKKILRLLSITWPHPLFTLFTFHATVKSFSIARKYFPETNSSHGVGNAFRHALWTCLILMYCCKISSPRKSAAFCKKITDLYEDLFPNEPLETFMDLHNNQIGIDLFMSLLPGIHRQFFETSFFVDKLLGKTKTAIGIDSEDDAEQGELVFLLHAPGKQKQ